MQTFSKRPVSLVAGWLTAGPWPSEPVGRVCGTGGSFYDLPKLTLELPGMPGNGHLHNAAQRICRRCCLRLVVYLPSMPASKMANGEDLCVRLCAV